MDEESGESTVTCISGPWIGDVVGFVWLLDVLRCMRAEQHGEPVVRRVQAELILAVVSARRRLSAVYVHGTQRRLRVGDLQQRHGPSARLLLLAAAESGGRVRPGQRPRGHRQRTTKDGAGCRSGRPIWRPVLERAFAGGGT